MANSRMVLCGLGILLVSFCFIRTAADSGGSDINVDASPIHAVSRPDKAEENCRAKQSDIGEECREDDQELGLYDDVDDTFRVLGSSNVAVKVDSTETQTDLDDSDSPDTEKNNIVVLGH